MGRDEKKAGGAEAAGQKLLWTQQVGRRPHTVTVFERRDKGLTIWLRWTPLSGGGPPDKMSLGFKLRDKVTARRNAELQAQAIERAEKAYDRLLKGEDPRTPEKDVDTSERPTIEAGLDLALRIPDGMYAVECQHTRDMQRYKGQVLAHLPDDVEYWDQISATTYTSLWRKLAHWRKNMGERTLYGEIVGKRAAELAVVLLAQAGRWLRSAKKLPTMPDMPENKWREKFVADWARITEDRVVERDQPRHTPEELGLLLLNVDNPAADPRIRLAFRLAGEARLGQALDCDRSSLELDAIGKFGQGRFVVPDVVHKGGVTIDLTPQQRAAIDYEMRFGYLRDLESAYQAKLLRTYPIFPGKRLVRGVARIDATQPISDWGATDMWHEFERVSGVAVVPGRSWYGVRRLSTDLAEDVESDERALNAISGHKSSETRQRVYQQKKRDKVLAKAAAAREAARAVAIEAVKQAVEQGKLVVASSRAASSTETSRKTPRGLRARPTFAPRRCQGCSKDFTPTGANAKRCAECSPRRVRPAKGQPPPEPTPASNTAG